MAPALEETCFRLAQEALSNIVHHARATTFRVSLSRQAENVVLEAGFKAVYLFRPGIIQPLHGARSRTAAYRFLYVVLTPLVWLMKAVSPDAITTTERVGVAMLEAARRGAPKTILDNGDINRLAAAARRG